MTPRALGGRIGARGRSLVKRAGCFFSANPPATLVKCRRPKIDERSRQPIFWTVIKLSVTRQSPIEFRIKASWSYKFDDARSGRN